jgi:hypothetical protein
MRSAGGPAGRGSGRRSGGTRFRTAVRRDADLAGKASVTGIPTALPLLRAERLWVTPAGNSLETPRLIEVAAADGDTRDHDFRRAAG